eukprot:scaffold78780_cov20-Tisochrysis_lutea.AAC.2
MKQTACCFCAVMCAWRYFAHPNHLCLAFIYKSQPSVHHSHLHLCIDAICALRLGRLVIGVTAQCQLILLSIAFPFAGEECVHAAVLILLVPELCLSAL